MPREFLMPELAESVVEGEVLKWLVDEGAQVSQDQPIVEVMTDKVTVELPSPFAGRLEKRVAKEGDVVPVHGVLALFAEEGVAAAPSAPPARTESVPQGQTVTQQLESTVADVQPNAESATVQQPEGVKDDSGSVVGSSYGAPTEAARIDFGKPGGATPKGNGPAAAAATNRFGRVLAVPAARKMARDNDLDIAQVPGSGPNGRVGVDDVRGFLSGGAQVPTPAQAPAPEPQAAPAQARSGGQGGLPVPPVQYRTPKGYEDREERTPLRGMRRAISNQMLASHLYTVRTLNVDEADLGALVETRQRLKPHAEKAGVKITYLPFIFKAIAAALKQYPMLNSSLDEEKGEIVTKRYYNIGMAVATPAGLMVPVIRDVDRKSVLDLAREISDVSGRARDGKLAPEEMSGSSFSVTNIGSIGALFSFPIINVPDAAIMGVHSIVERPVVRDGRIVARPMMYLSLSYDHRLVDGAEAAYFTKAVIRLLENPDLLILEGI